MNKKMDRREFDNILDECLERVIKGESIDTCLALYPQYAGELKPLLETAVSTRAAASIEPRPEFRRRAALDFQKAIQQMPDKEPPAPVRWRMAVMAPLATFIVILLAATGTAAAARNSLPDSPLYRVKLATESVQLALTFSDIDKAELYARLNDKRVDEIVKMAEQGKAGQIVKATEHLNSNMLAMAELTGGGQEAADNAPKLFSASGAPSTPPQITMAPAPTSPPPKATYDTATTAAPPPTTETAEPSLSSQAGPTATETEPPPAAPPPVTISIPPATTTVVTVPPHAESANVFDRDRVDNEEELKQFLTEKQVESLEKLYKELEQAPDWLKPQIQRAIDIILQGYDQSISNLQG